MYFFFLLFLNIKFNSMQIWTLDNVVFSCGTPRFDSHSQTFHDWSCHQILEMLLPLYNYLNASLPKYDKQDLLSKESLSVPKKIYKLLSGIVAKGHLSECYVSHIDPR